MSQSEKEIITETWNIPGRLLEGEELRLVLGR